MLPKLLARLTSDRDITFAQSCAILIACTTILKLSHETGAEKLTGYPRIAENIRSQVGEFFISELADMIPRK